MAGVEAPWQARGLLPGGLRRRRARRWRALMLGARPFVLGMHQAHLLVHGMLGRSGVRGDAGLDGGGSFMLGMGGGRRGRDLRKGGARHGQGENSEGFESVFHENFVK